MKRIIKIFFIIFVFILLTSIYIKKVKSPLINFIPITLFQIQSGSMFPNIKEKEIVVVCKKKEYKENDIITYKTQNNYFITHRIKEIRKEGFITKGDFNNTEDKEIIKLEQIQGKVIFHTILLGKIYEYRYYIILILCFLYFSILFNNIINKKGGKNVNKIKKRNKNKKR